MELKQLLGSGGMGSNILIYGASNGISSLAPFVLIPVLTAYLTPAEFGEYSMFLLMFNMATIVVGLNTHGGLAVLYHKVGPAYPDVLLSGLVIPVSVFSLIAFMSLFISDLLANFLQVDKGVLALAVVAGLFNVYYLIGLATFQASNRAWTFLKLKLLQATGDVLFSLVFVVTLAYGLEGRINAHTSIIFLCMALAYVGLRRAGMVGASLKPDAIGSLLRFGVPLVPHALAGSSIMFIDRVVLTDVMGIEAAGLYMVALQIAMAMTLIVEPVNKALAPWLFKNLVSINQEMKHQIVRISYAYFAFLLSLAFCLWFFTDWIFLFFVDPRFHAASQLGPHLYLGFSFQGMYYTVTNYILFKEKTRHLAALSAATAVIGVLISYTLVNTFGITGAAMSFMLSNLVLFLGVWYVANQNVPMPWFNLRSTGSTA